MSYNHHTGEISVHYNVATTPYCKHVQLWGQSHYANHNFPCLRTFISGLSRENFQLTRSCWFSAADFTCDFLLIQFFSISRRKSKKRSRSRRRGKKRSRWGARELSTVDVLGGKMMTFWDGDVQYVSNMLVIYWRCFIIFK